MNVWKEGNNKFSAAPSAAGTFRWISSDGPSLLTSLNYLNGSANPSFTHLQIMVLDMTTNTSATQQLGHMMGNRSISHVATLLMFAHFHDWMSLFFPCERQMHNTAKHVFDESPGLRSFQRHLALTQQSKHLNRAAALNSMSCCQPFFLLLWPCAKQSAVMDEFSGEMQSMERQQSLLPAEVDHSTRRCLLFSASACLPLYL